MARPTSPAFDLSALRAALDRRRADLGLSWTAIRSELGISPSTLSGLGTRPVAEGDGVLRVAAGLGRTLESFVPGSAGKAAWRSPPAPAGGLRFDTVALFAALEQERSARGLTWRQVAAESGVRSPAALTRLRRGGRLMFPEAMSLFGWPGASSTGFVRVARNP